MNTSLACCAHGHGLALKAARRPRAVPAGAREANTYGLPLGLALRRELRAALKEQLRGVRAWLDLPAKADLPDGAPPLAPGDAELARRMAPHLAQVWDEAGKAFLPGIGQSPDGWKVSDPHLRAAIGRQALDFCAATNATSLLGVAAARDATRDALRRGMARGEANRKLARRLGTIFDDPHRAARIAATEAARGHNAATMAAGAHSGVVIGWRWLPASNACPTCLAIAATVNQVRVGQPFATGFGNHPIYSTIPHPPAHCWCRCSMTAVLDPSVAGGNAPAFGETMDGPPKLAEASGPKSPPEPPGTIHIFGTGPVGATAEQVLATAGKIGVVARDTTELVRLVVGATTGDVGALIDIVGGRSINFLLKSPQRWIARRIIEPATDGHPILRNVSLYALDTVRRPYAYAVARGYRQRLAAGAQVLRQSADAIDAAHALDLARFGFDCELSGLPYLKEGEAASELATLFPGTTRLSGLLMSRAGREWWARRGGPAALEIDPQTHAEQFGQIESEWEEHWLWTKRSSALMRTPIDEVPPPPLDLDVPPPRPAAVHGVRPGARATFYRPGHPTYTEAIDRPVDPRALQRAAKILGRPVSPEDLAALAGAPEGTDVWVALEGGEVRIHWHQGDWFATRTLRSVVSLRRKSLHQAVVEDVLQWTPEPAPEEIPADEAKTLGKHAENWMVLKSRLGALGNIPAWANAATERVVGYELKHYAFLDRRTGYLWEMFPTTVKGIPVPFGPARVRISDGLGRVAFEGKPANAPFYNLMAHNCQDGYKVFDDLVLPPEVSRKVRAWSRFSDEPARALASQVVNARRLGVGRIDTRPPTRDHSHYQAALLGFDAPLPPELRKKLPQALKDARVKSVSDLMRTPEGRAWWHDEGKTLSMSFDLKDGSPSMEQMLSYLRSRGVRTLKDPLANPEPVKALAVAPAPAPGSALGPEANYEHYRIGPGLAGVLAACWGDQGPPIEDPGLDDEERAVLDHLWDTLAARKRSAISGQQSARKEGSGLSPSPLPPADG